MLRRIGVDVAGMSTVPEVVVAASIGMRILGLSVVTNVARPDVLAPTTGQQVIDAAETAAPRIYEIVSQIIAGKA
jgi:purine-nucleoside phosphorylase